MLGLFSNRFNQPSHLTEHSIIIRGEGLINLDIPKKNHGNSLRYPCLCLSVGEEASDFIICRPRDDPPLPAFDPSKKCNTIFGVEGHTLEECEQLRHRIQDLINNKLIQFDNAAGLNAMTNPLTPHQEGNVNAIFIMKERILDFSSPSFPLKAVLWALAQESHIVLENVRALRFDQEICTFCHSGDRHTLFNCRVLMEQVQSLANHGIIWIERKVIQKNDCMAASLYPTSAQVGTSHIAMTIGSRKDKDEYLRECLCKIPPAPLTLVVIKEIIESPMDLGVRISDLKLYCTTLCMTLCVTLRMT